MGLVRSELIATLGRPAQRWFVTNAYAKDAENAISPPTAEGMGEPLGVNGVNGVSEAVQDGTEVSREWADSDPRKDQYPLFPKHKQKERARSDSSGKTGAPSVKVQEPSAPLQASSVEHIAREEGEI